MSPSVTHQLVRLANCDSYSYQRSFTVTPFLFPLQSLRSELLYAREIIPRPPTPRESTGSGSPGAVSSSLAGPSNPKVKTEKGLVVKQEKIAGKKRTSDQAEIIDLSFDEEKEDGDDITAAEMAALSPEELIVFKKMKVGTLILDHPYMSYY